MYELASERLRAEGCGFRWGYAVGHGLNFYMWWLIKIPSCWKAILRGKKLTFANLSRTPCLTFAGSTSSRNRLGLVVLHSSLSTSIKHHFGAADEVEVLQGRLARTLNHHHWMNQQNWRRMSWKSYQRLLRSSC